MATDRPLDEAVDRWFQKDFVATAVIVTSSFSPFLLTLEHDLA
jgi:hypothetical protein